MKKWGKVAGLVSINLLLTVGFVEAALRFFPTIIPANLLIHFEPTLRSKIAAGRFPTADDAVTFERTDGGFPFSIWKPFAEISYSFEDPGTVNTVKMDELGFCNEQGLYSEQPQFDVIGLGDSFTWCTTVAPEDTWVAQLAEVADVSAYNLGKPAIGLYEYLQFLERFGLEKSPKVVVLNVYEGNDLRDALKYVSYRESGATDRQVETEATFGPLSRYSYVWNLGRAIAARNQSVVNQGTYLFDGYSDEDENFRYTLSFETGQVPFNLENGDLDEVAHAKLLTDGRISTDVFSGAIARFVQIAEDQGFTPILAYTPSAYTAYADAVSFDQTALDEIMPAYSQELRAFFAAKAQELDIKFIDLTPGLQAAAPNYTTPEKILYYQTNRHLTKYGHQVVAELLSDVVEQAVAAK